MTLLAAAIMIRRIDQALADSAKAAEHGADLVEFRLDAIAAEPTVETLVAELVAESALPCIITCRPTWEGGEFEGDERLRLDVFGHACAGAGQPAYLDVELRAYQSDGELRRRIHQLVDAGQGASEDVEAKHDQTADEPGAAKPGLILSYHDFETRPSDLDSRLAAMAEAKRCRVLKVAWAGRSLRDNVEAFEIVNRRLKPTIALCMGPVGLPSRVLAKKFGALLTFAAVDRGEDESRRGQPAGTAPGQPTVGELKQLYRWDKLGSQTRVFGVIGHPVGHSLSPHIHNAGFDQTGVDAVYLPMPIPPEYEHFKATVGSWLDFASLHFGGASVTIPHKQNLLRFVEEMGGEIEPLARTIGAANTLSLKGDRSNPTLEGSNARLYASNTDYAAALDVVCERLAIARAQLSGERVAVIGAGGAARAVVAGFAHYGSHVVIYNRSKEKADALASDFADSPGQVVSVALAELHRTDAAVIINCTPIGMHPNVDDTPLTEQTLRDRCEKLEQPPLVFDTIYNPAQTRLLREARAAGCMTIRGTEMFIRQGAAQFELWTAQPAPLQAFRDVMARGKAQP